MMNVVSSLCASETDGESLWTTIACRQGPRHRCLKNPWKPYIKERCKVLWFFFHICLFDDRFLQRAVTTLPACMLISAVAEQHPSQKWQAVFPHDSLSLHLPSFPDSHFPSSLHPFLHLSPLLLMLSASQHAHLQRHHTAENKCLS